MENLPNELLTKIAELCPESTISALCRCSLRWNMVATKLLYSNPDLRFRYESPEHGYKWTLPFAFLIFTSPFHARCVRSFTIGYWWADKDLLASCGPKRPWPVSENDAESVRRLDKVIADACREHTVSEEDAVELYKLVRSGENGGAILALVVAHLVNLRKFDFEGNDKVNGPAVRAFELVTRQSWINSTIASSTNSSKNQIDSEQQQEDNIPPTPFSKPLSVRVTGKCEDGHRNESFYAALFFKLPNLRHLYIWLTGDDGLHPGWYWDDDRLRQVSDVDEQEESEMEESEVEEGEMEEDGMNEDNMDEDNMDEDAMEEESTEEDDTEDEDPENLFFKLRPRSCAVESIELRASKLLSEHFDRLMRAAIPGKLKTLIYEIGCIRALVQVEHQEIMRSLSPYHDTLECLELSHDLSPLTNDSMVSVSFTQFTKLKKLKVAPIYVWGLDVISNPELYSRPDSRFMLQNALPPALTEFWISRATTLGCPGFTQACLLPALREVILAQKHSFPQLETMYFSFEDGEERNKEIWLNDLYPVGRLAKEKGITLYARLEDCTFKYTERRWGWYEDIQWKPMNYWVPDYAIDHLRDNVNNGNNFAPFVVAEQIDLMGKVESYRQYLPEEEPEYWRPIGPDEPSDAE